jgi:hypothetical protein
MQGTKRRLAQPTVHDYGTILSVTLNCKSKPGDGTFARGVKGQGGGGSGGGGGGT